jgi:site-specific recombinase
MIEEVDPIKNLLVLLKKDIKYQSILNELLEFVDKNSLILGEALFDIAVSKKYVSLVTESGISNNDGFFSEVFSKLGKKILPEIIEDQELLKNINFYFDNKYDFIWLNQVPEEVLISVFSKIKWPKSKKGNRYIQVEILNSVIVLAQKIASAGIEKEVVSKISDFDDLNSPFIGLNRDVTILVEKILKNPDIKPIEWEEDHRQVVVMINQCAIHIKKLYDHKEKFGISLKMTIIIRKLEKYLNRLKNLLKWLSLDSQKEKAQIAATLLKELVYTQNTKNSIKKHFNSSLEFLSFKVVENTSKSGENYIASTTFEYWKLFRKALGGGIIVAFLCWFKTSIYYLFAPAIWTALLYSLNYAMGFVLIHLLKFTLATKQPAMTASTIAESLSNKGKNPDWLNKTTKLLTRQIRSQFISLVGNAIIAFPVAAAIGFAYFNLTGQNIATITKANTLINELNVLKSPAIFHAAIAGVYLMLSGLVSGYYENFWVYHNFQNRISKNLNLLRIFGQEKLNNYTDFIGRNIGGISGNIFLGFMLGSTANLGRALGLMLDIRHVTFASGNFGIAFSSLNYVADKSIIINSVIGIIIIGVINVLVSFGLSITIALLSRGTNFSEIKLLLKQLIRQFIFNGRGFFYPTRKRNK